MRAIGWAAAALAALGAGAMAASELGAEQGGTTEKRHISEFTGISNEISANVVFTEAHATSLSITGPADALRQIVTEVRDHNLEIKCKRNSNWRGEVTVTVTGPHLNAADLSGSGNMTLKNLHGKSLAIAVAGSGNVHASGHEDSITVSVSGSGNVDARSISPAHTAVEIAGSGNVRVGRTENLKAEIAGSGTVKYQGDPHITKEITGSGSVERG